MLRGPPLFILAVIALALALCLVSIAPARAAPGASPAQSTAQNPPPAREGAYLTEDLSRFAGRAQAVKKLNKTAHAGKNFVFVPTTFICDPPVLPGAQPRPIPPGKKIEDLCPTGAHAYLYLDPGPFLLHIPPGVPIAPAVFPPQDTGGVH